MWTTTDLLSRVRDIANIPDAGGPSDQGLLDAAYDIILTRFEPAIRSVREAYGLTSVDTTLVAAASVLRIPSDAQAGTLRDVLLVDSAGRTAPLANMTTQQWALTDTTQSGTVAAYVVMGDRVHFAPKPTTAQTVRLIYYRRASKLVPVSSCFAVASKTATTITVTGSPSWTSGTSIDVVQANPAFSVLVDAKIPSRSGSVFTFSGGEDLSEVAVGDYVALHMETCVPGIPAELHSALYAATAAQVLTEDGDRGGAGIQQALADRALENIRGLIDPRVEGRSKAIINRSSPLRSGRTGRGRLREVS